LNPATAAHQSEAPPAPPRKLRILVADDDRDTVLTLVTILRNEGHTVAGVYRGTDVLQVFDRLHPDAVILDIAMPGQSGFSVVQDIRASSYGIVKPLLIAISGQYVAHPDKQAARGVGFDHYFTKPCKPEALLAVLRALEPPPQEIS